MVKEKSQMFINVTKKFKEDYYNLHMEMTHVKNSRDHPDRETTQMN